MMCESLMFFTDDCSMNGGVIFVVFLWYLELSDLCCRGVAVVFSRRD